MPKYMSPIAPPFIIPLLSLFIRLTELPINMLIPVITIIAGVIIFSGTLVYDSIIPNM